MGFCLERLRAPVDSARVWPLVLVDLAYVTLQVAFAIARKLTVLDAAPELLDTTVYDEMLGQVPLARKPSLSARAVCVCAQVLPTPYNARHAVVCRESVGRLPSRPTKILCDQTRRTADGAALLINS